jgi:hypothetical protein
MLRDFKVLTVQGSVAVVEYQRSKTASGTTQVYIAPLISTTLRTMRTIKLQNVVLATPHRIQTEMDHVCNVTPS